MLGYGVGVWGVGRGRGGCAGLSVVLPHVLIVLANEIYRAICGCAQGRERARRRARTWGRATTRDRPYHGRRRLAGCPKSRARARTRSRATTRDRPYHGRRKRQGVEWGRLWVHGVGEMCWAVPPPAAGGPT